MSVAATGEPIAWEWSPAPEAADVFLALADLPHLIYFDSARRDLALGRYSFLAADPVDFLRREVASTAALDELRIAAARFAATTLPELPPFQGGYAGLFSYDLGRQLERIPAPRFDEFASPVVAAGLYDVVVAFDHLHDRAWIISHGWPESDPARRRDRAAQRLAEFRTRIETRLAARSGIALRASEQRPAAVAAEIPASALAPQFPLGHFDRLTSTFSRETYLAAVRRAIDYIYAGDIFQVNLSQRLLYPATGDPLSLYLRLRERNPAPFAGYFDLGDRQIVSASPERFVRVTAGQVETRPIKGTRYRVGRPEADLFRSDELRTSDKDRAENVMIVDLLRNDLAKVCLPDSVRVTQLCEVETYSYVQHLVSSIVGTLLPGASPLDLIAAAFPGGSITGAPKPRAMEIIAELEPTARGAYCGALGYLGADGSCDTNLLIRTITAAGGWWQFPVGGGIVAASDPEREYQETWHKAEGLLRAIV